MQELGRLSLTWELFYAGVKPSPPYMGAQQLYASELVEGSTSDHSLIGFEGGGLGLHSSQQFIV